MGLLVTSCTSRKRVPAPPALSASSLKKGEVRDVVTDWVQRLCLSSDRVQASRLYAGRSFSEANRAATALGGEMLIISAGLGAVRSTCLIPPYGLSAIPGSPDDVLKRLAPATSSNEWWARLCERSPFHTDLSSIFAGPSGIIVVALSDAYLTMAAPQFVALESAIQQRLRILTRAPHGRVPVELQPYLMPYDDRLDGPDSDVRGTKADFASRAARDFVEVVLKRLPDASAGEHRGAVIERLSSWRYPTMHARTRLADEDVLSLLRERWDEANGQSSRLLRVLRDDLNVACEQGRFVGLMNRLREERSLAA